MPKCEFSEFTFGYAVLRQTEDLLENLLGPTAIHAPILPSLLREHELGYDAHLVYAQFALMLQFKLAMFVSRRPPRCGNSCTWCQWHASHYYFSVSTDSAQHRLLLRAERLSIGRLVGYVAPGFHTLRELDERYLAQSVPNESVLVVPSRFPGPQGPHKCSYKIPGGPAVMLSEPREVEVARLGSLVQSTVGQFAQASRESNQVQGVSLADLVIRLRREYPRATAFRYQPVVDMAPSRLAFRQLNDFFAAAGAALILIGRDENSQ